MGLNVIFLLSVLSFYLSLLVHSLDNNYNTESLDAFLQDSALEALLRRRPHTGALYKALLPANLSGIEVSIVRLRSRRLWSIGANFSNFKIPPRTKTMPHVKRMAIVYQDLGNWSSRYYNVPGYTMITSAVGFMIFNASDERATITNKISLNTRGKRIVIWFPNSTFSDERMISGARCVAFGRNGKFSFSEMKRPNVCYSQDQGHFSIVVPLQETIEDQRRGKQLRLWFLWLVGFVLGLGGLIFAGYFALVSMNVLKTKKIQVMERQADEDLVLETRWLGSTKMPSATVTRTQPSLEDGGL